MNDSAYSNEIDLGRKEPDLGEIKPASPAGKKGKPRVFYPSLYIDNVEGIPSLPKEGRMLVEFRRKRMSVEENMDGKETAGVTLEIRKLCLPEDMAEEGDDMASAMKDFAKGNGVDTGTAEAKDDRDDDDGDEE